MRSRFVDKFSHDEDAPGYDLDVLDDDNPVRAGYRDVLDWVAGKARTTAHSTVLDLGAGTGNLSGKLEPFRSLTCVDASAKMMAIGQRKLGPRGDVTWIEQDLLEFMHFPPHPFDIVVSTYAVHHLTDGEKAALFRKIWDHLNPGGRAVFGDLMFANREEREAILSRYREADGEDLAAELEDEFPWDVEAASRVLEEIGFQVETKRFSELSWGILAGKPR